MSPNLTLSDSKISTAIEKGLTYLHQHQRPSGEFPTYFSPRLDMVGAKMYPKSVYITTFVIHSLCYLPTHPLIEPMQQRAAQFLLAEQEEFGAWYYEGQGNSRIPPDLDDTSCAVAALLKLGYQPALSYYMLLWQNEAAPTGPYYTWIGINDNSDQPLAKQVDALVNANILFSAGLLTLSLPNTITYLQQIVQTEAYEKNNLYTVSPHFFIYCLTRAYADGQVTELKAIVPTLEDYILNNLPSAQAEPSAFNLACLASSLLNLQTKRSQIEPYLKALLNSQQTDGGWPVWGAYAGYRPNYDGGPALTTGLALEALGKYCISKKIKIRYK